MKVSGYTLIELVIVVSLMAIILLGGTGVFYQNLKSSGLGNVNLGINSDLRSVLSMIEKDIRYSMVSSVGIGTRTDCLAEGPAGFAGNSLTVVDLQGMETVYLLDAGRIASVSSTTARSVYLTNTSSRVTGLQFFWYCQSGVSDKIKIEIDIASSVIESGFDFTRNVSREINLLNSGLN
jgi:prepilin-type N-terminal cleavage/methylation domain-containing protein